MVTNFRQLCTLNLQMLTFEIDFLIQFLASYTCFEHHVFTIMKTICTCSFVWYVFFVHLCQQSSRWMDVKPCLRKCRKNIP